MTEHVYRIYTHDGEALRDLDQSSFTRVEYIRTLNDEGWFEMIVDADYPTELLDVDRLIEFWRQPEGGINRLEMVGFLRKWEYFETPEGVELLRLSGPDQMTLLRRSVIAFVSGSSESDKTDFADDMLKEIVDEAKGAGAGVTDAGRFRGYPATNFSIMADLSDAPSVSRSFPWRDMFPVLQEIAETSRNLNTPLYFDIVPGATPATFEFQTFTEQRGIDRTQDSGNNPVIFSKERGNLIEPSLIEDWSEEWNYVYGGGQGEGASRLIDPERDLPRIRRSIWNRREAFQDAREEDTLLGTANRAFARMQQERPRLIFSGKLLDSALARYGVDWFLGDRVTARYKEQEFDGEIRFVRIALDSNGAEDLEARLEVTLATG